MLCVRVNPMDMLWRTPTMAKLSFCPWKARPAGRPAGRRGSHGEQLGAMGSGGGSPSVHQHQVPGAPGIAASAGIRGSSASRLQVVVPAEMALGGITGVVHAAGGLVPASVAATSRNSSALSLHRLDDGSSMRGLDEGRPSYCGMELGLGERPSDSGRSTGFNPHGAGMGAGGGMPPAPPVSSAHAGMYGYARGNSGLTSPGGAAMRASPSSPFQVQTVLQSVKEQLQARFLDAMAASAANNVQQTTSGDGQGPGWSGGGRRATTNSMFVEADTLRRAAAGAGRGGGHGQHDAVGGGRGGKRPTSETSDTSQRSSGQRESDAKRPTSDAGGGFAFRTSASGWLSAYPIAEVPSWGASGGLKGGPEGGGGWFVTSPGQSNAGAGGSGGGGAGGSGRRHRALLVGDDLSTAEPASSSNAQHHALLPPHPGGGQPPALGSMQPLSLSRNARAPPNSTVGFDPLMSIGGESSGGGAMDVDAQFGGAYRMSGGSGSGSYTGEISMAHAAPLPPRDRPSAPGAYGHHSHLSSGSGSGAGIGGHSPPVLRLSHTGRRSHGSSSPLTLQHDALQQGQGTAHLFMAAGGSARQLVRHGSLHGGRHSGGSSSPHSRLMSPSGAASPSRMSSSGPASPSVAAQSRLSSSGHRQGEMGGTANAGGGSPSYKAMQQASLSQGSRPASPVAMSRLGALAWGSQPGEGAPTSSGVSGSAPQVPQEQGPSDMQQG